MLVRLREMFGLGQFYPYNVPSTSQRVIEIHKHEYIYKKS
jgi:hypothetical protein